MDNKTGDDVFVVNMSSKCVIGIGHRFIRPNEVMQLSASDMVNPGVIQMIKQGILRKTQTPVWAIKYNWDHLHDKINPLLVVATIHSGTKYTSQIFQAVGLDIGHEKMGEHGAVGADYAWRKPGYEREMTSGIPDNTVTVHQVREPFVTIASLSTIPENFWRNAVHGNTTYYQGIYEGNPLEDSTIIRCMKLWLNWNQTAEKLASYTYRVENMEECFPYILELIGLPTDLPFPNISKTTNKHEERHQYSERELYNADSHLYNRIKDLARKYGYSI